MEIIEEGKLPSDKKFQARCPNCKTLFRFLAGEATIMYDQRDGNYFYILCPLRGCNTSVAVAANANY